jgi:hypothetical protein
MRFHNCTEREALPGKLPLENLPSLFITNSDLLPTKQPDRMWVTFVLDDPSRDVRYDMRNPPEAGRCNEPGADLPFNFVM